MSVPHTGNGEGRDKEPEGDHLCRRNLRMTPKTLPSLVLYMIVGGGAVTVPIILNLFVCYESVCQKFLKSLVSLSIRKNKFSNFWGDLPQILLMGGPKILGEPKNHGGT